MSCSKNDTAITVVLSCDDGLQNGNETGIDCGGSCFNVCLPANAIFGEIVSTLELYSNKEYLLTGPLLIRDGAQLIIQEGVTIRVEKGADKHIAITQGGKIFIYGRETNPVVITSNSSSPAPGDWGGLVICGKAPTNDGGVGRTELLDIFYGGNDIFDSSGLIQYLRVEYAGANYSGDKAFNGVTFYGVGAYTSVKNIQSYMGRATDFEFVGGTVSANRIIGMNGNSAINIQDGWNGSLEDIYLVNHTNYGIKISNNVNSLTAIPLTSGVINNLSLIGSYPFGGIYYTNGGATMTISNIYTSGLDLGFNIIGDTASQLVDNAQLTIENIEFDNSGSAFQITNYIGSNTSFYTTGISSGAGNSFQMPDWAANWTIGF